MHEIKIQGEIDSFFGYSLWDIERELDLAKDSEGIRIKLNSPGGSVFEGLNIFDRLLAYRESGKIVEVELGVTCASIATIIAAAASPGKIKANYYTLFMIHEAWTYTQGDADQLKQDAALLESINKTIVSIYHAQTGKPKDELAALMKATTWFTAEDALAAGFVNEVIPYDSKVLPKQQLLNFYNNMSKTTGLQGLLNRVIKNLGMDEEEKPEATTPVDSAPLNASTTLADGTTVYHDGEVATGIVIYTDEEMTTPVGAGTHTLSDGTIVITDDLGVVVEITTGEELVAAVTSQMQAVANFKAEMAQMKKEIETLMKAPTGARPVNRPKPDATQAPERVQKLRGKVLGASQIENFSHLTKAAAKLIPNEFKK